jgi:hypothetical protein
LARDGDSWTVPGQVVPGYGVASGAAETSPYPSGTIALQTPHFLQRGLDLRSCYPGTLNVSITPYTLQIVAPVHRFEAVAWLPGFPAETFSFAHCHLMFQGRGYDGWIYYPHPETKPRHSQPPTVVEILAPAIANIHYGAAVTLQFPMAEVALRQV